MEIQTTVGTPLLGLLAALLLGDLVFTFSRPRPLGRREAALWTLIWVAVALGFFFLLGRSAGPARAMEFLAGYLIEKALSVDNLFVFMILLSSFSPPTEQRHRVLALGILLSIALRGAFIFAGVALVERFHFLMYGFGALLLWTGVKLMRSEEEEAEEDGAAVRWLRRLIPSTKDYRGWRYVVWEGGRPLATPLGLLFLCIAFTDVVFALDSIPAVMAVSRDPLVILSANVLALLGLRALFFLIGDLLGRFHYLKPGLALLLSFIGGKMLLARVVHVPIAVSLGVIAVLLGGAVLLSVLRERRMRQDGGAIDDGVAGDVKETG